MKTHNTKTGHYGIGLLLFLLVAVQIGFAQNQYPASSDVILDGRSVRFQIPTTTGGWARGGHFYNPTGATKWGGVGLYGVSTTQERIYLAHGTSPHASLLGMHILSSGNIGIGTISPSGKLEIIGNPGEQSQGQLHLVGNGEMGPGDAYISFWEGSEVNSKWSMGVNDSNNAFSISYGLTMDADPKLVVKDVTGYVGIGTTNPTGKLQIKGEAGEQSQGQLYLVGNGETGPGDAYISFWEGSEVDSKWSIGVMDNDNAFAISHGLTMDAAPKFVLKENSGFVGIGTTAPDAKLTVKGNIHAEEVKVDLSVPGPDYVFKEDYNLRTLEELQQYIKENGHLPNIPSAAEMEETGVELGTMNMKLLEKIEELMLYTIAQQKELQEKTAQLMLLEKRLKKIEQLLIDKP
ncbi:tail fiber protein [Flavobacteriaceae bacterium 3-367]|uniref:tail fiber protein n=1 Tax=Eudoraea algarum TaxID=3417568 RepID=UPI00328C32A1